ncbi:leukocyte surface antigen CD53-like [Oscarella lobularis]|uniref:leukocyte surface antigen CD53-like n=1 Tax=Oscarella lobularis TaxID=121494 RepID=UPI0033130DA6
MTEEGDDCFESRAFDVASCCVASLFLFNVFFFLSALTIVALGIWLYVDYGSFLYDIGGQKWTTAPALIITAGACMAIAAFIVIIVFFTGCSCDAVRDGRKRLLAVIFIVLPFIGFILYASAGLFSSARANDETLSDSLYDSLSDYNTSTSIHKTWNFIQEKFECCGVNSSADWLNRVPDSCCNSSQDFTGCGLLPYGYFDRGCYVPLKDVIVANFVPVGIWVVVMAVLQIVGIAFACYLFRPKCWFSSQLIDCAQVANILRVRARNFKPSAKETAV